MGKKTRKLALGRYTLQVKPGKPNRKLRLFTRKFLTRLTFLTLTGFTFFLVLRHYLPHYTVLTGFYMAERVFFEFLPDAISESAAEIEGE